MISPSKHISVLLILGFGDNVHLHKKEVLTISVFLYFCRNKSLKKERNYHNYKLFMIIGVYFAQDT